MRANWLPTTQIPGDGDSIWIVVLEKGGESTSVEYAITFVDYDGLIVSRREGLSDNFQQWPPRDVLCWMPCDVPEFSRTDSKITQEQMTDGT